jgi:hypothetical protein
VLATKHKLTLSKILLPTGDDKLSLKGEGVLPMPFTPPLDPITNGVRLILRDALDDVVVDATIGGGAYDPATRTGWRVNGSGTSWTYKNPGTQAEGITTVGLRTRPSVPGLVKFKAKGKNGAYVVDPAAMGVLPVQATLILDPPLGATGQCLDVVFAAIPPARPSCGVAGGGSVVRCK